MESPMKRARLEFWTPERLEQHYMCSKIGEKILCLLCNHQFESWASFNIQMHFETVHRTFDKFFTVYSSARCNLIRSLKAKFNVVPDVQPLIKSDSKTSTQISHLITNHLVKQKKSLSEAEDYKELLKDTLAVIFENTMMAERVNNIMNDISFSITTMAHRVHSISSNLRGQLLKDISVCDCFSLQLDDSTDVTGVNQLIVFIRFSLPDGSVREDFLTMISLQEHATKEEIYNLFKDELIAAKLPLQKLVSITTSNSATTTGKINDLLAQCRNDLDFPKFTSMHCMSQRLALCAKRVSMNDIFSLVVKIVDSILTKPLNNRIYAGFKEAHQLDTACVVQYKEVEWLNRGIMLNTFYEDSDEIVTFLKKEFDQEYSELTDFQWITQLAFLGDVWEIVDDLRTEMDGKSKSLWDQVKPLTKFVSLLEGAPADFANNIVPPQFKRLEMLIDETNKDSFNGKYFADLAQKLCDDIDKLFPEIEDLRAVANFLESPREFKQDLYHLAKVISELTCLDIGELVVEMTMLEQFNFTSSSSGDIWETVMKLDKFGLTANAYKRLRTIFGTTYLCHTGFSHLNSIKTCEEQCLNDQPSEAIVLTLSNYLPKL